MASWSTSDSSGSSSSDDDGPRAKIMRVEKFVEAIVPRYDDKVFQSHFRVSRTTVNMLIGRLDAANVIPIHTYGIEKITNTKSMLSIVNIMVYLSNTETFRQVSDRFDTSLSSAHSVVSRVLDFLNTTLKSDFIVWASTDAMKQTCEAKFLSRGRFRNVIGTIDGCHVRITKPVHQGDNYVNRKGYPSIIIQDVCNANKVFTDVFCGEPGSLHDARVLRRSNLHRLGQNADFVGNYCLLGDSAYRSLPWLLLTPHKDNGQLTPEERQFNFDHSSQRIVIEHAFGLLKSRFRRLFHVSNYSMQMCVKIVMVSCVLHNICIEEKDNTQIDLLPIEDL